MNSDPVNCTGWNTKLDLYLDGELPSEEMRTFDAHVRGCAACAADALARVQMKRAVKVAGKQFSPSKDFRRRLERSVATNPKHQRTFGWRGAFSGALAGLLLAGALSLGYIAQARHTAEAKLHQTTYNEIADLHVATLASSAPVDVTSTDRHTVKPWFQGKIPFAFNLPELQNSDFSLLGGRVTYLQQAPGAHLIYELRKHKISVLIFQAQAELASRPDSASTKAASFNAESWNESGLRYFVIGDASADDIHRLAEMFRNAAHG